MSPPVKSKPRRGAGEGALTYDAARKNYRAAYRFPDGTRRYRRFPTRTEGREWLKQMARLEAAPVPDSLTVDDLMTRWLDEAVRPHREPKTYKGHECNVRIHLRPALGGLPAAQLTSYHVQTLVNRLSASGRKPATVDSVVRTIRACLNQCVRWGLIPRNPVTGVQRPKEEPKAPEVLSEEDTRRVLTALAGHRLYPLFALALGTGLRQGEILALRRSDIDLDTGEVRMARQLQRFEGVVSEKSPKWHSIRTVVVPGPVLDVLRRHCAGLADPDALLFTGLRGQPLNGTTVTQTQQRLLSQAGLPPLRFHGLRHVSASLMLALGCTMEEVAAVLGHRSTVVTRQYYAHALPGAGERVAGHLGRIFAPLVPNWCPDAEPPTQIETPRRSSRSRSLNTG